MLAYYELIENTANLSDKHYDSIKDLTIDIAVKAGYHRAEHTCKNGNKYMRTFYTQSFDDVLVAKWFMYYKNLFLMKLGGHREFEEYYTEMMYNTFLRAMKALQIEKLSTDSSVNELVNISLRNRICETLYTMGSQKRLRRHLYNRKRHKDDIKYGDRIRQRSAVNHMACSLDGIISTSPSKVPGYEVSLFNEDIRIDLERKLSGDSVGLRLLEAMLNSKKKIQPTHIDDFVNLSLEECTEETRAKLSSAWSIIEETLKEYLSDTNMEKVHKWGRAKKFRYSFEER